MELYAFKNIKHIKEIWEDSFILSGKDRNSLTVFSKTFTPKFASLGFSKIISYIRENKRILKTRNQWACILKIINKILSMSIHITYFRV